MGRLRFTGAHPVEINRIGHEGLALPDRQAGGGEDGGGDVVRLHQLRQPLATWKRAGQRMMKGTCTHGS